MMKSFGLTSQIRHHYPPPHRTLLLIVVPILIIIATSTIFIRRLVFAQEHLPPSFGCTRVVHIFRLNTNNHEITGGLH
jgi:hypothetical protein